MKNPALRLSTFLTFTTVLTFLTLSTLRTFSQAIGKITEPAEWVNPLMGTMSKPSLSTGNTYPAIAVPWGMNFWMPQTGKMGDGWAYQYDQDKIRGFKQTHQPSPWMNDYGQFAVMPVTGKSRFEQDERASWFSHKSEVSKPYFYSVYLADMDVTTELTTTERAAQFRFTFPKSDSSYVVVDALDKGSYIKVLPKENKIIGYSTRHAAKVPDNFKNYFVIYFDKPFSSAKTWEGKDLKDGLEITANHSGAIVGFKTKKGEKVGMKVASSFISFEQADISLKRELGKDNFDVTKNKAKDIWNKTLSRIEIEGGSIDQARTFYSCLYRTLFFPNKLYEINAKNEIVHWSPYNGKTLPGYMFAGTGFLGYFPGFVSIPQPHVSIHQQGNAGRFSERL